MSVHCSNQRRDRLLVQYLVSLNKLCNLILVGFVVLSDFLGFFALHFGLAADLVIDQITLGVGHCSQHLRVLTLHLVYMSDALGGTLQTVYVPVQDKIDI